MVITKIATIAASGSLSDPVHVNGDFVGRIIMPAAWTAAVLTFQLSRDGVTYHDLYDTDNSEISLSLTVSRIYRLDPSNWTGIQWLKIRSGTGSSPINQAAERQIILELWS